MNRKGWAVVGVGVLLVAAAKKRTRQAREVYLQEVSTGTRPIQAVGTAVAAFVGFHEP